MRVVNFPNSTLLTMGLPIALFCLLLLAPADFYLGAGRGAIFTNRNLVGTYSAAPESQPRPKLSAEMEPLKFYIGDWSYAEEYPKSTLFPSGGHNTGYWTAQIGPRGLSIVHTFASHGAGDNYEGLEIMTWDPKEKLYRDHSLWFDSPDQWSYTGHFEGNVLVYRAEFDVMGKHVQFRSETRSLPGGGFTLDEFAGVNGGPEEPLLHGRATPR